jgi:hypothetical protein
LSNTQIYKNANYISVKLRFKAGKLLTYYQKKLIKKGTIDLNSNFLKFKIPKVDYAKKTETNIVMSFRFLKFLFLKFQMLNWNPEF